MIIVSKNVVVLKASAYKTLYNVSDELRMRGAKKTWQ